MKTKKLLVIAVLFLITIAVVSLVTIKDASFGSIIFSITTFLFGIYVSFTISDRHHRIDQIREIMKATGAYDYCVKLSMRLLEQSRQALIGVKLSSEGSDYLLAAVEYLEKRFN